MLTKEQTINNYVNNVFKRKQNKELQELKQEKTFYEKYLNREKNTNDMRSLQNRNGLPL